MQPRALAPTVLALLALGAAACSDTTGPGKVEPITELPRQLSLAEEDVRNGSNAFAFRLAPELLPEEPDENLFWSPLSASMALGMLLNGADGESYAQLRDVLGFQGMSQEEINDGYRDLTDLLLDLDPGVTVAIGNSVWTREGFPVLPDFHDRVEDAFGAEAAEVDLASQAALDRINGWASDATNGLIDPMFTETFGPGIVALLLNAVYFKADWTTRFDEDDTRKAPFTREDGSTVEVDLMRREGGFKLTGVQEASLAELSYGGGAFAMTLALPRGDRTVGDLVEELTPERWADWTAALDDTDEYDKSIVMLPRFELEWEAEMSEALEAVGMVDLFHPATADLSRLSPAGGFGSELYVDFVKQKAFVSVDERGTEAAAATAVGVGFTSGPPTFRADRPFLFVLRERLTGTILFMGVVNDPTN